MLEWYGCADLFFSEFQPPVTALLAPGAENPSDVARKISQIQTMSMVVVPRWQISLLDTLPAVGTLVRRDFVTRFHGKFFVIYSRGERYR
jgi:hypothetical protein